jgi:hypothetical protein
MYPKTVPKPLQLPSRKLRKPRTDRNPDGRIYDATSGGDVSSTQELDVFGDIDSQSSWEASDNYNYLRPFGSEQ